MRCHLETEQDRKAEALDRYRKIGTKIYRTDVGGNIIVTSDGKSYQITTE